MSTRRILKRDERQPAPAPALHPALGAARAHPPAVQRKQQQQRLDRRESCWQACIRRLGLTLSCCVGGAAKARHSSRSGGSSSREVAGGSRAGQAAAAATSAAAGSRLGRVLRPESEAGAPCEMERLYNGASSEDDDGGSSCGAPRGAIGGLRPPADDRRGGGWRYSDTASTSSSTSSMRSTSYFRSEESVSSTNSRYSSVMHSDDKSCASSAHTSSMNASNEGTYWSPEEQRRRRQRGRRQYNRGPRERRPDSSWSRSSSSCSDSITDSTVSLNVITVTLNTDATNFLGISLVGQSGSNGDGGIYVGSVMQGGAVDMDGRIEAGDMILEVNGQSFDRLSNDEAVHLLRDAVKKPGSVTLVVAKCWEAGPPMTTPTTREADRRSNAAFLTPRQEPVRPIDPFAWVAHTTALQNQVTATAAVVLVPTPAAGGRPDSRHRQPAPTGAALPHDARHGGGSFDSPSTCSSGDATLLPDAAYGASQRFAAGATAAVQPDAAAVVAAMVRPDSGLDVRDRTWLKVTIPSAFIGSDLVDWLLTRVRGFVDRSEACSYAAGLLKAGYIQHTVNKEVFSEQCYYVFGSLPPPNSKVQNGSRSYYANPACATSPTDTLPPRHAAPQPYAVSSVLLPNSGHLGKSLASSRQGDRSWGVDRSPNAPTGGKLPVQRPLALVAARPIGAVSSELTNSRASFHAAMENPWGRDLCSEEAM